jgi:predicted RNase H-like nuclease (RuvC/YqgF family)
VVYLQQRPGRTKPTKVQSAIAAFLQQWQREDEHEIQAVTHEPKRHKEVSRTEFDAQCETVSRLMNRVIHLEGELSALKKELGG